MTPRQHWFADRVDVLRGQASRGATLVEYALVAALVLVVSLAALEFLTESADAEISNQADCVSDRPPPVGDNGCDFAPVPDEVTHPDPNIVPPVNGPIVEFPDIYSAVAGPASEEMAGGWTLVLPVVVAVEIQEPPAPPIGAPDVTVRARVMMSGVPGESFTECITDIAGECELRFSVPYGDVNQATMLIIGVDSSPPPEDLPPMYTFVRP